MAMIFLRLRSSIIAIVVLLLANAPLGGYAPPKEKLADDVRTERWRQDLEFFARKFPAVQLDFRKLYSPVKFREDINDLERDAPRLPDSEIVLRLMRLVAAGKVSHITVHPQHELEFHPYPLKFFWYSDGPGLTAAKEEYKSALGTRVVRIGSMTPEQLESAVEPYLSHENQTWLHELSPDFMLTREVAGHFGLAQPDGSIEVTLARPGVEPFHLRIAPSAGEPRMVSAYDALALPVPLFRKRPADLYWYEYLPDSHALNIQYDSCQNDPKKPFRNFIQEMLRFVDGMKPEKVDRIIVDLRFNSGGDSSVIEPLMQGLLDRPQLSARGHLYVLIGRSTFSSGVMAAIEFRNKLQAILVGEPSGSAPNEYGEIKTFALPNSKILVQYTTKYFRLLKDSNPRTLAPDLPVQRSIADFLSGHDQVLETALKHPLTADQPSIPK